VAVERGAALVISTPSRNGRCARWQRERGRSSRPTWASARRCSPSSWPRRCAVAEAVFREAPRPVLGGDSIQHPAKRSDVWFDRQVV